MAIGSFKRFVTEDTGTVFCTFGRCNPPGTSHGKLFDSLAEKSGGAPYKIFMSQTEDTKNNPLSYSDKVKHNRKMFPKHARNVMINKKVKTIVDAATVLYAEGHVNLVMVVGSDRVNACEALLEKYNGVKARHGFYNFKTLKVISAGYTDPDSKSSKCINEANDNFAAFSQGVPASMSYKDTRKLFNDVRKGMGIEEESSFKNHIELDKVSDTREQYIKGDLYALGDRVKVKEDNAIGTVSWLGTNYIMIDLDEGGRARKWVDAVDILEDINKESAIDSNKQGQQTLKRITRARTLGKRRISGEAS